MPDVTWRLTPHAYAAVCGDDLVLLDVQRDSYFCLPQAGQGLELALGDRRLGRLDPDLAGDLAAAGLVEADGPVLSRQVEWIPPAADLLSRPLPTPRVSEIAGLTASLTSMAVNYRRRSFAALLARAQERRKNVGPETADPEIGLRAALAFRTLLPWSPVQGACLFQAVLLLDYLGRRGQSADWVFGVRTWPFIAHCWLQSGAVVLNDTVDRVRAYQPILIV